MGRDLPSRRGSSNSGSPVGLILLIVGLVVGIPAIIAVVIFGLAFFAAKKGVEAVDQVAKEHKKFVKEMDDEFRELERKRKEKEIQDAFDLKQKKLPPFDPWPNKDKEKEFKPLPILPPPPKVQGNQIDLIALIDPVQDKVFGNGWQKVNNELHCTEGNLVPRIEVPYIPPAEYDFIVTFSQPGLRNGISLIMPNPNGGSFFWYLGSENGAAYGFHSQLNKEGRQAGLIKAKTAHTTVVQVRRNSLKAFVDNKEVMNFQTDYRNLTSDAWRPIRDKRLLAVACDDPTVFHFVRLVEINGAGQRTR